MKVWTKVHISDQSKEVNQITTSIINYATGYGPMQDIYKKYKISREDQKELQKYTLNRVSGLVMLYLAKDTKRMNDIINKYYRSNLHQDNIVPEIEGYIEK